MFAKEKRHLTEKFQKLSANTNGLEETGEVFLCMCTLLKIPRGETEAEITLYKHKGEWAENRKENA